MSNVIKRIRVISSHEDISYSVGDHIAEIKEACTEWENSIDHLYLVKDINGNLLVAIENCPVVVEYEQSVGEST